MTPEDRSHNPAFRQGKIACELSSPTLRMGNGAGKGVLIREQGLGRRVWPDFLDRSGSSRASPRRTPTWRVSTASCARNACASAGSRTCSRPGGSSLPGATGLIPVFRTEASTIFVFRKGAEDVEEQVHRSADDFGGQADGSRPEGRGCGPRSRSEHTHELCLEVEVRRHGCERGSGSQAVAG